MSLRQKAVSVLFSTVAALTVPGAAHAQEAYQDFNANNCPVMINPGRGYQPGDVVEHRSDGTCVNLGRPVARYREAPPVYVDPRYAAPPVYIDPRYEDPRAYRAPRGYEDPREVIVVPVPSRRECYCDRLVCIGNHGMKCNY